jgi:peroxisomal enoyl-CoA hydratase 2
MPAPGENFSLGSKEVTWLKRDLLLFAASIGIVTDELNFVFVGVDLPMNAS